MNLGELFFNLGFKTSGTEAAKAFENVITTTKTSMDHMAGSLEYLAFLAEEFAIKMGVITKAQAIAEQQTIDEYLALDAMSDKSKKASKNTKGFGDAVGDFSEKIADASGKIFIFAGAVSGAAIFSLYRMTKSVFETVLSFDKLHATTGLSISQLQQFETIALQAGISVNDIAGAVANLQTQSVNIRLGRGGPIGTYAYLGLNPHEDPIELMDQLGKKLRELPTALGTVLAKDLGFSDDMIYLMKEKSNSLTPNKMAISESDVKHLRDYNFYLQRLLLDGKRLFRNFLLDNQPMIDMLMKFGDDVIEVFGNALIAVKPFFEFISKHSTVLKVALIGIMAVLNPKTTIFAGILAIFEDIYKFAKGQPSLLGDLVDWWDSIGDKIQYAIDKLTKFLEMMGMKPEEAKDKTKGLSDWRKEYRKSTLKGAVEEEVNKVTPENALDIARKNWGKGTKVKPAPAPGAVEEEVNKVKPAPAPYQGSNVEPIKETIYLKFDLKSLIPIISEIKKNPYRDEITPQSVSQTYKNQNTSKVNNDINVTINVDGSKKPLETGQEIKRILSDTFWNIPVGES